MDSSAARLLRGFLEPCLLSLLAEHADYGLSLAQRLAAAGLDEVPGGTLYPALMRLEKRGLVQRWRSVQDKRVMVVRITEQGRAQVASVVDAVGSMMGRVFEGFSDEERRVFLKALGRIPALLAQEAGERGEAATGKSAARRIAIE